MEIMNGEKISSRIKKDFSYMVKSCMIKPSLAIVQLTDTEEKTIEIENKIKVANEIGVNLRLYQFPLSTSEREIMNKIVELNNDEYVNGVSLQLPLPSKMNTKRIVNCIEVSKDVEGMTDKTFARFYNNRKCFIPYRTLGVLELLEDNQIDVSGKHVVIINRSNNFGKPLAHLLLKKDATVTICHSKTPNIENFTKTADILIVAVGQKDFIKADMVKDGVVMIDAGYNEENGQIYGDVNFEEVKKKASYMTVVPGGVEVASCTMLLKNVLDSYNNKITSK